MNISTTSFAPHATGRAMATTVALTATICFFAGCAHHPEPAVPVVDGPAPTDYRPAEANTPPPTPTAPSAESAPVAPVAPPAPTPVAVDLSLPPYQQLPELEGANWTYLFDGKSMAGWKVTDFAGRGEVELKDGRMVLGMGAMLTGVNLTATNDLPRYGYELAVDVMKLEGSDFFCGLTFVVGDSCCSLIAGGWGGGLVGISSINNNDASMNETTSFKSFEANRWFRIRVKVTRERLEAWIGADRVARVDLEDKRISVRPGEIEMSQPFGIATFQTTTAIRSVQWRKLD